MSNFPIPGAGDGASSANMESLLAQLRRQGHESSPRDNSSHSVHGAHSYFGQPSPDRSQLLNSFQSAEDSPGLPPTAPTPPGHGMMQSQYLPPALSQPGGPRANDERTANLLNLLKFSDHSGSSSAQEPHRESMPKYSSTVPLPPSVIHAPAPTAADPSGLLAALMKGNLQNEAPIPEPAPAPAPAPSTTWTSTAASSETQQLLNLLNRPKPSQGDAPASDRTQSATLTPPSTTDHSRDPHKSIMGNLTSASTSTADQPSIPSRTSFDFEPKDFRHTPPKFQQSPANQPDAASAFGQSPSLRSIEERSTAALHTDSIKSSPAPAKPSGGPLQILKKEEAPHTSKENRNPSSVRSPASSNGESARRRVDQAASPGEVISQTTAEAAIVRHTLYTPDKPKQSVSDAVSALASKADEEAQAALVLREQQTEPETEIARDLEELRHAKTEQEFEESAKAAAQAIKKELDKDENKAALESTLLPEVAQAVRDIVDDAANGVADSWESADADEIVVIEEEAPTTSVKVYNFEMKPWISLTVQADSDHERAIFRDESIVDIARLKKEFDQMDRNLVSASKTFIAYAMSKAGGIRIIRQDDGRDGKVFTDTQDRIFNIAMSATAADSTLTAKEAIVGTGTSGSVYWVLLKDGGEKDYLDEDQWEQNGFILPPIGTQEGDAPGGVLKTRARTSSSHPEFFAVGRGKTINIIWPAVILQNNLFKPGPDRTVDTDRLLKQCSLRINTGKAGKDFAFSHDDSTIVSLDKSGRVKFWDVRDLTYVAEGSSLPLQTTLEVKEPLMTLNTTPDGEKAWPTSVLLLDKQRPYQKGTALRYMIVGMKQNHTLQLWDLALGKPVQEFNLPHENESDAACSVLYDPPTGMIVVGHPTRNSIYFLHLSAPKYTLKSFSQVDYIQRLVAQDSSIPQPGSTAVISGMREYSFENRGILRSLDILGSPVNSPPLGEGLQPHFELYAMHSKGVTCMVIKQPELGWTKDNKVDQPTDAEKAGVVKVSKLILPPVAQVDAPTASDASRIKIALRPKEKDKDTLQKVPSSQGEEYKGSDGATPGKVAHESRESEDAPLQMSEKSEKKGRKKVGAGAAAAAAAAAVVAELNSNGHTSAKQEPRAGPSSSATETGAHRGIEHLEPLLLQHFGGLEGRLVTNISAHVDSALDGLDRSVDKKLKHREMSFENRQAKLLEMVSDVLNDNTQKVLTSIVHEQFETSAMPVIRETIAHAVADQLSNRVGHSIAQALQKELHKAVPSAVAQSFSRPEIAKTISDRVVTIVLDQIEDELLKAMNSQMIPAFTQLAAQAAQRVGADIIRQVDENIARLEQRHHSENAKMDQLVALNTKLSHTIASIATSQTQLQNEILNLKHALRDTDRERERGSERSLNLLGSSQAGGYHGSPGTNAQHLAPRYGPPAALPQDSPQFADRYAPGPHGMAELPPSSSRQIHAALPAPANNPGSNEVALTLDQVIDAVATQMRNHNYHEAIVTWLRNEDKSEAVFQTVLVKYSPQFISDLSPLVLLSTGSMVTKNLLNGEFLTHKLAWTELVLTSYSEMVHGLDDDLRQVTPKIMSLLKTRLEQLFLNINNVSPRDPVLKNITNMTNLANRIIDVVRPSGLSPHGPY